MQPTLNFCQGWTLPRHAVLVLKLPAVVVLVILRAALGHAVLVAVLPAVIILVPIRATLGHAVLVAVLVMLRLALLVPTVVVLCVGCAGEGRQPC
jgi:hypothetical protein